MKKVWNKKIINKEMLHVIANKLPLMLIWVLMIFVTPLGVYFFVIRVSDDKRNIYNKGRSLINISLFIIFLLGVGIYKNVRDIIELYSSGMSLDMIKLLPDNLWMYLIGILMVVFFIKGGRRLIHNAKLEQVYTKAINIYHEKSIKEINKGLGLSLTEVKNNIKLLCEKGYLVPLEIDNKKNIIVYKDNNLKNSKEVVTKNNKKTKKVQCVKCGSLVSLKLDEYVECDFCGHGLIDER